MSENVNTTNHIIMYSMKNINYHIYIYIYICTVPIVFSHCVMLNLKEGHCFVGYFSISGWISHDLSNLKG